MGEYPENPGPLPVADLRNRSDGGKGPLVRGDGRTDLVKHLQKILIALGFDLGDYGPDHDGVDGVFGEITEKAVRRFQSENKDWDGKDLKVDSKVGSKTSDALNRALVGQWYDDYKTPSDVLNDLFLLTASVKALADSILLEIGNALKVKVVTPGPVPKPPPKKSYADQDMWAKSGGDVEHSGGGKRKYPERNGNYLQWLQDGAEAMYAMCDAFCRATRFIWIIDSYFSPGINLVRGDYYNRIKSKYSSIVDRVTKLNNSKGISGDKIPLISLLSVKAAEGVKPRIVIFRPDFAQDKGGGPFGWKEAWEIVKKWPGKIDLQLAMWGGTYEGHEIGGHHQKAAIACIDDRLLGFCGGVDLAYARWALSTHSLSDPLDVPANVDAAVKIDSQMGWIDPSTILGEWNSKESEYRKNGSQVFWHDVHVKVAGPSAADLADNFVERYSRADSYEHSDHSLTKPNLSKESDFVWLKSNLSRLQSETGSTSLLDSAESYSSGKVHTQILRSYYPAEDYGIWDVYRNLFKKAKKNLYIESQYAFEDASYGLFGVNGCFETLRDTLRSNKELKVIVLAPVMPDSYDSDILDKLRQLVKASMIDPRDFATARLAAYSLVSRIDSAAGSRRVPIYVHAKVAVADDEWAIAGSANLDRMGMGGKGGGWGSRGSSELAMLVHGMDQSLALRGALVKEHLGSGAPSDVDDFDAVFNSFQTVAAKNGRPRDNKVSVGQVVFHRIYKDT